MTDPKCSRSLRTLDLVPNIGEMIKPAELIDTVGATGLTLSARRLYNLLIANAFGPGMGVEGTEFEVQLTDVKGTHAGNDRIGESIEALMRTIVVVRLPNGDTRRVALLGGNDMGANRRDRGRLCYSFDPRLVPLLRDSRIFGVLEMRVMAAFGTKYALSLYEALCRRVRMDKVSEDMTIEEMREVLGVPHGKLEATKNLRPRAIEPAAQEINALAPFSVRIEDIKRGRSVIGYRVWWWQKSRDEYSAAIAELERPRAGRAARINGTVEALSNDALIKDYS